MKKIKIPKLEEVDNADHEQICRWVRFCPSPTTQEEVDALNAINVRLIKFRGFTPEISKRIGW